MGKIDETKDNNMLIMLDRKVVDIKTDKLKPIGDKVLLIN